MTRCVFLPTISRDLGIVASCCCIWMECDGRLRFQRRFIGSAPNVCKFCVSSGTLPATGIGGDGVVVIIIFPLVLVVLVFLVTFLRVFHHYTERDPASPAAIVDVGIRREGGDGGAGSRADGCVVVVITATNTISRVAANNRRDSREQGRGQRQGQRQG